MSLATRRLRAFGFELSPLLQSTRRPPIGFLPARSRHSAIGRTSQTCHDRQNPISSARASSASPDARADPA
eukprot:7482525-Alexandrium_andersonii.AAC.1